MKFSEEKIQAGEYRLSADSGLSFLIYSSKDGAWQGQADWNKTIITKSFKKKSDAVIFSKFLLEYYSEK